MKNVLVLFLRVLVALVAAVVALGVALDSAGFWSPPRDDLLWLLLIASVVAFLGSASTAVREFRAPRSERRRHLAATILWVAFDDIQEMTKIKGRSLGVAAYKLRRRRWVKWKMELEGIYRVRARERASTTDMHWAPGKGILGLAVSKGEFATMDVEAAWAPLASCSQAEWNEQPDDVKLGLSYDEFTMLNGKHGTVVAAPIISPGGAVSGCVVIDAPGGFSTQLETLDVQTLLADTALSLYRSVLKG